MELKLLTDPIHKEADLGIIFMDSGGYLNMCGHRSIGCAGSIDRLWHVPPQ